MNTKVNFSAYQKAIFNEVANGASNIVVNAVAGSGKTFTIVEACKLLKLPKEDVLFLAFNNSIIKELEKKIGAYANVMTTHKFGFETIKKASSRRVFVDKEGKKFRTILKNRNPYASADELANARSIFDLCRVNLIQSGNIAAIYEVARHNNIAILGDEVSMVSDLLNYAYRLQPDCQVDFGDMLVLAATQYKAFVPTYKVVFIDECQDLNTCQRVLMSLAARDGRFVAVGDPHQAINGFAGADCESFAKIQALPNTQTLPLSVNYRCGSTIIDLAQSIVPQITAHDGAIKGEVTTINEIDRNTFKANDFILCRKNAPLVGLCLKLIGAGISASVKGRDIGSGLVRLIQKSRATTIDGINTYLNKEWNKVVKSIIKHDNVSRAEAEQSPKAIAFMDKINCINAVADGRGLTRATDIIAQLETIFSNVAQDNAITLSSVHKSKGLESDRVFILLPDKLPMIWKGQLEWQYQQEVNLRYVAITRAKKSLTWVTLDEEELKSVKF